MFIRGDIIHQGGLCELGALRIFENSLLMPEKLLMYIEVISRKYRVKEADRISENYVLKDGLGELYLILFSKRFIKIYLKM